MMKSIFAGALMGGLVLGQTNFTGDILHGYPVISVLDIADVPANTISRYWISAAQAQGGLDYFVPVFVARGTNSSLTTGRKLSLSASIHGDELNGIPVVQRVFASINETVASGGLNGTIIGVPTMNPNGNIHNQPNFYTSSDNGYYNNLNRLMPGTSVEEGGDLADAYDFTIWNNLWGNTSNVDIAVDLHTLSIGSNGPFWAYADFALPGVQRLAELAQPDIIKIDSGEPGSVETTWVGHNVPAITLEIGPAKIWNRTLITRAENFIYRLMDDLYMDTTKAANRTGPVVVDLSATYKATNLTKLRAMHSGWIEMDLTPLQDVTEGEVIGNIYNSWGDVLEELTAPATGKVLTVNFDPAVEKGAGVLDIVYNATSTE